MVTCQSHDNHMIISTSKRHVPDESEKSYEVIGVHSKCRINREANFWGTSDWLRVEFNTTGVRLCAYACACVCVCVCVCVCMHVRVCVFVGGPH